MNVKIMRGVPGSGKSTYAKKLAQEALDMEFLPIICSADEYFMVGDEYKFDFAKLGEAHKYCLRKYMQAVQDRHDPIIVDNTNINIEDIAPYVAIGEAFGYNVEVVQVNTSWELAGPRNVHGVPTTRVRDMHKRLTQLSLPKRWKSITINP